MVRLNADDALKHPWLVTEYSIEERRPESGMMQGVTDSLKKVSERASDP